MAQIDQKIYTRIQHLFAIQESRGATEAEAALAAEHVQRLLQEYNLTLASIGKENEATVKRSKNTTNYRAMYIWQRDLMRTIAENSFCLHRITEVWLSSGEATERTIRNGVRGHIEKRHVLVGRDINVQVAQDLYAYLLQTFNRLIREAGYHGRSREGTYYFEGMSSRVIERLKEKRREQERKSKVDRTAPQGNGTGHELILSDVYGSESDQNNDVLNGFPIGTTAAKRREREAAYANQRAEYIRLVAEGVNSTVAWYQSLGYAPDRAVELAKISRHASRHSEGRRRSSGWTQGQEAHYRKVNSSAYRAGREAGGEIGLDMQVSKSKRPALPKK